MLAAAIGIIFLSAILSDAATDTPPTRPAGQGVSVRRIRSGDSSDLVVENNRLHDITLTLSIKADNATVQRLVAETATYRAHSRTVAARLFPTDAARPPSARYHFRWVKGAMKVKHDNNVVYHLPFRRGTSHKVIQGYGGSLSHQGQDYYAVDFGMSEGTLVCAARDGLVVDLQQSFEKGGKDDKYRDQSNFVSILHDDGTIGEYAHLQHDGVLVELGQRVTAGAPIARSGNTGYSTWPHLHFGVYTAVDGTHIQSHPMTFTTRQGIVTEPVEGRVYTAK
jgi:murein DD-endopeptidase MepM/ murein hydrolase activator NlpD